MRSLKFLAILATLLLIAAAICLAQTETGQISGTVKDASDAVVANAKVTVKSANSGVTRETTTNSAGLYSVPSLRPDRYEVVIEATGFQKFVSHLDVTVGSTNDVSAKLSVGTGAVTIEVSGTLEGVAVNTETSTLAQVVSSKSVEELPSLTRNPYDFVVTAGNVAEDPTSNRGAGFAVNGQRSASTSVLLDGGENVNTFTAGIGQQVPLDSLQEFSVVTNNFSAEFGRAGGGVVNVVTKAGTNSLHGTAYEFNRLSALTANTYNNAATDQPRGHYTRNQFGYSVGGPIKKDKLFFFSSTEWIRVRSSGSQFFDVTDPSFFGVTDPESGDPLIAQGTIDYFNTYGALRPGTTVVSTVPWGQAVGSTNCPDSGSTYLGISCAQTFGDVVSYNVGIDVGGGYPQNNWETVGRVDYNLSSKSTLFVRYALNDLQYFPGYTGTSPYVGYDTSEKDKDQNVAVNFTHVFSPNLVSTSKIIYNRLFQLQGLGSAPLTPGLFSTGAVPALPGTSYQYVMPGYVETSTANALPFGGPQNLYQFYEDVSWTKSKHQFKFGGSYIQIRDNRVFGAYENAVQILGRNFGDGLNNLVSGQTYQFEGAVYPQGEFPCSKDATGAYIVTSDCTLTLPLGLPSFERNFRYNDFALYAQDSWKILPRLTLNLGARWEYYGVQHNANPAMDSNFYFGSGSTIFDQIRNGGVLQANKSPVGGFWQPSKKNVGPRIGFAYDVFGDGKTSVKGGYGISFERNFGNVTYNVIQNPPNYAVISIYGEGQDVATQPIYTDNLGAFGGTGTTFLPNVTLRAPNAHISTAYAQNWNFSVDRELAKNTVLSLEYAGSHGVHLYDIGNINVAYYGSTYEGDARAANRLNYQYGNINFRGSNAWSKYNGFNAKFSSTNVAKLGIDLNANYTYSHSRDNLSSTFSDGYWGNYFLGYTDYFNPTLENGNSDFDIRHRITMSAVWQTPWFKNSVNPGERYVLGGWEFAPIFTAHTGSPYSLFDCSEGITICPRYSPNGFTVATKGSPVNQGGNNFNYMALPVDPNYNPIYGASYLTAGLGDALQVPNQGIFCPSVNGGSPFTCSGYGMPERNGYVQPGIWTFNLLMAKNLKLTEKFNLQFRGEMYNVLNHHNYYINTNNLDVSSMDPSIPYVTAVKGGFGNANDDRRFVQLALKLTF